MKRSALKPNLDKVRAFQQRDRKPLRRRGRARRRAYNPNPPAISAGASNTVKPGDWSVKSKGGVCRCCGVQVATHLHHAVPRSLSVAGQLDLRNGLPLCSDCHMAWHAGVPILRTAFTAEEWAFVSTLMGPGWLGRRYPRTALAVAA